MRGSEQDPPHVKQEETRNILGLLRFACVILLTLVLPHNLDSSIAFSQDTFASFTILLSTVPTWRQFVRPGGRGCHHDILI